MKSVIVVIIIALVIAIAGIVSIYTTESVDSDNLLFLDIEDYTIIQEKEEPLFLSVTTSEKIPRLLKSDSTGYGYGWFESDSGVLAGYTVNIHSENGAPQWHVESISINDSEKFCFDDVTIVDANVIVDGYNLNVTFEHSDTINFDRIVSYQIVDDHSCHLGVSGIIVEQTSTE